ncbi:MAG: hypothetical protein GX608_07040 [Lentisphaerae bacterium]|nr:hypothetical protein [Lentisphaerota bacterium]
MSLKRAIESGSSLFLMFLISLFYPKKSNRISNIQQGTPNVHRIPRILDVPFNPSSRRQEIIWKSGKLEGKGPCLTLERAIQYPTLKSKEQGGRGHGGLGYAHSHLSLTWTLDIPCWLLDILLMSFAYSVQHQQS